MFECIAHTLAANDGCCSCDLFFHSQLIEDGHVLAHYNELRDRIANL